MLVNDHESMGPCFEVGRETNNTKRDIKPEDSLYGPLYKKGVEDAIKIIELVSIIIDQMEKVQDQ